MFRSIATAGFLWLLILGSARGGAPASRSRTFGRDWVRSHPFTITGLLQSAEAARDRAFVDAGLNTMLVWKPRPPLYEWAVRQGIPWHYHINKREQQLTEELKAKVQRDLARPGCSGVIVWDEPKLSEMKAAGEIIAWVKSAYPDLLVYTNALPMAAGSHAKHAGGKWLASGVYDEPPVPYSYDDYLNDIMRIMQPDVLMMDQYPFVRPPEGEAEAYYQHRYFACNAGLRKAALRAGVPYWVFIQAYETEGGGARRLPSESDVRMQVYSSLASGVTGIGYFTYDPAFARGLLEKDFTPNQLYRDVAKLDAEVANLGRALRFLTSTDIRYISGEHLEDGKPVSNPVPDGIGLFHPRSRVAEQVQEIILPDRGSDRNAMIGFFTDDQGGDYFMIVNLRHGEGVTAEQGTMPISIRLAPSVRTLVRLSRQSGKPEPAPIFDGRIDINLSGGTGELFRIGEGSIPGLQ